MILSGHVLSFAPEDANTQVVLKPLEQIAFTDVFLDQLTTRSTYHLLIPSWKHWLLLLVW